MATPRSEKGPAAEGVALKIIQENKKLKTSKSRDVGNRRFVLLGKDAGRNISEDPPNNFLKVLKMESRSSTKHEMEFANLWNFETLDI